MPIGGSTLGSTLGGVAGGAATGTAILPGIGTILGGILGALTSRKKTPATVPFDPVSTINAGQEATGAINTNIGNEGSLEQLLSASNRFQQGQASDLMEQAVPGYGQLSKSIIGRAQENANDPYSLPKDVQDNLRRLAAEKGINVGTAGQTRDFSGLRDLGINMLDYGNNRLSSALSALTTISGTAPRISPLSPLNFMLTPGQALTTAGQNANIQTTNSMAKQGVYQGAANARAATDNTNNANLWQNLTQMILQSPALKG